jgi:hypothetical protein
MKDAPIEVPGDGIGGTVCLRFKNRRASSETRETAAAA